MSTKEWVLLAEDGASIYQECFYDFDRFDLNPNPAVIQINNPKNFSVSRAECPAGNSISQINLEIPAQEFDEIAAAWCLKRQLNTNKYSLEDLLDKSDIQRQVNEKGELSSGTGEECDQEPDTYSGLETLFDKEQRAIKDPTIFYRFFSQEDIATIEKASVIATPAWKFYVCVDEDYLHPSGCTLKAGTFIFSDCDLKLLKFLTDYPNSSKIMYEVEPGAESEVIAKIYITGLEDAGNSPDWIVIDKERPLTSDEEESFLRKNIIASGRTEPLHFGDRAEFSEIEV